MSPPPRRERQRCRPSPARASAMSPPPRRERQRCRRLPPPLFLPPLSLVVGAVGGVGGWPVAKPRDSHPSFCGACGWAILRSAAAALPSTSASITHSAPDRPSTNPQKRHRPRPSPVAHQNHLDLNVGQSDIHEEIVPEARMPSAGEGRQSPLGRPFEPNPCFGKSAVIFDSIIVTFSRSTASDTFIVSYAVPYEHLDQSKPGFGSISTCHWVQTWRGGLLIVPHVQQPRRL